MKKNRVVRYKTLRECFLKCIDQDNITKEEEKTHYWLGHNGKRPFRLRIDKWLARKEKVWGWCNYKDKEIHIYYSKEADIFDVIRMLSHELGHFKRPRYPFGGDEEKKAEQYREVTSTAISIAVDLFK